MAKRRNFFTRVFCPKEGGRFKERLEIAELRKKKWPKTNAAPSTEVGRAVASAAAAGRVESVSP
jgi:hypothetical protein|tara:strand:- start:4163 stop:4354 length:192 start_codon:yes stop_codon:yes gene_type:complete